MIHLLIDFKKIIDESLFIQKDLFNETIPMFLAIFV